MITVGVIRNGATYLSHHLRKNDYWSEGEKAVQGEWIGQAAPALGLAGAVTDAPFEALRLNRHPQTGEPLTQRLVKDRVAFFDIQLSAPKDVSVLALVGGDERVRSAFAESVRVALDEMERFAAVRERRGEAAFSEKYWLTSNFVGALFHHDASRDLDPQLHAHAVLANVTWDADRNEWMALQPAEMMRASAYVRQVLYRELAIRLRALGYDIYEMNSKGFAIRGVEHLRERFSKRARHVQKLAEEFTAAKGRKPTKREVEVLVRESRQDKLTEATTPEVRARQRAELNGDERAALDDLVRNARAGTPRLHQSYGWVSSVLEAAFRHVYERNSVAREGEVLKAALELHPDFYRWRELREALENHADVIRKDGEMSLRPIRREETQTIERVKAGRNRRFPLGKLPKSFQIPTPVGNYSPDWAIAFEAVIPRNFRFCRPHRPNHERGDRGSTNGRSKACLAWMTSSGADCPGGGMVYATDLKSVNPTIRALFGKSIRPFFFINIRVCASTIGYGQRGNFGHFLAIFLTIPKHSGHCGHSLLASFSAALLLNLPHARVAEW